MIEQIQNVAFEKITITVSSSAATVPVTHTTKFGHKELLGIALLTTDDAAIIGSTMGLVLDGADAIFEKDFEPRLIMAGVNCPVNERYFNYCNRKLKESRIEINYVDAGNAAAYPYTVQVILMTNKA
jgi:hypothetical protein